MRPSQQNRLQIVYISGPMRGLPEFNYPAFNEAARMWRSRGFTVFNPAENFGGHTGMSMKDYMRRDLMQVLDSDFVVLLPRADTSIGSCLEVSVAQAVDIPVIEHNRAVASGVCCEATLRSYLRL